MRKSVFLRFFGLLGLYGLIFVVMSSFQFAKKGSFSLRVHHLTAEGRYRALEEGELLPLAESSPLAGDTRILYGGLEFLLPGAGPDEPSLYLIDEEGGRYPCFAEYMVRDGEGLRFYLSGDAELFFDAGGDGLELQIAGDFKDDTFTGLELTYRPLRTSRVRDEGNGQWAISAEGRDYHFGRIGAQDRGVLVLQKGGPPISYRAVERERVWRREDYVLAEAAEDGSYREALLQWSDKNYSLWGRLISSRADEDLVIAYEGEALRRGTYKAALSAVPRTFLSSPRRSYESSVYLGDMAAAYRGLTVAEGEQMAHLVAFLDRGSTDFLLERGSLEFLALRGREDLLDRGIALIRTMNPPSLRPEQIPGLLEALTELRVYRPRVFDGEDSGKFDDLTAQAELILSECLNRVSAEGDLILAFRDGRADTEWNLRLGKALADWGEGANGDLAAIGRSIVLSVLSLEDGEGRVPSSLILDEGAGEDPGHVSTARLYRLLGLGDYRPRARALSPALPGLWTWTAAAEIQVVREGQILDIAPSFPPGESHYMVIRGLEPFYRLQFYGMDWRSDPNFERYDSSGWVYYAGDRTLVLKVKHRSAVEHIRIYTGARPPPVPARPAPEISPATTP
ncbi:MAG: hypothetical protein LBQ46_12090 [Treponema sp.]|jgi:hypothetical protein|nr:hypothetical protein [Treponema sp.]